MSDTGMQPIETPFPSWPSDLGAKRVVVAGGAVFTYNRRFGSKQAYITVVVGVDADGDAPAISAFIPADDAGVGALDADGFCAAFRAVFAPLVAVLR